MASQARGSMEDIQVAEIKQMLDFQLIRCLVAAAWDMWYHRNKELHTKCPITRHISLTPISICLEVQRLYNLGPQTLLKDALCLRKWITFSNYHSPTSSNGSKPSSWLRQDTVQKDNTCNSMPFEARPVSKGFQYHLQLLCTPRCKPCNSMATF